MTLEALADDALQAEALIAVRRILEDRVRPAQRLAFRRGVDAAEVELGRRGLFDPAAQRFAQEFEFTSIRSLTARTSVDVRHAVLDGIAHGKREEAIAADLRRVVAKREFELRRIARTEVNRAANWGRFSGYKESRIVEEKEFIATPDDRVRPDHWAADGEVVPLDEAFTRGAAAGLLAPPCGPNCRCTLAARTKLSGFRAPAAVRRATPGLLAVEQNHVRSLVAAWRQWPRLLVSHQPLAQAVSAA